MIAESPTKFKLVFLNVMLSKCILNVASFPQTSPLVLIRLGFSYPPSVWLALVSINSLEWPALVCSTISHTLRTQTSAGYLSGFLLVRPLRSASHM